VKPFSIEAIRSKRKGWAGYT